MISEALTVRAFARSSSEVVIPLTRQPPVLLPNERLDTLGRRDLVIIQSPDRFSFSIDSVLLAHFARVRRGERVLDLGTGSGVVPLLLSTLTEAAELHGLEIDPATAGMACRSVAANSLEGRVIIRQGDLREAPALYGHGAFDVVTVNPPYRVPGTGLISPSPAKAVARHELSCTLEDVVSSAGACLRYRGRLAIVHLPERLVELMVLLRHHNLEAKRLRMIHPRQGRPANLVLIEALKGGRPGLAVAEPLFVHTDEGKYTPELLALYGEDGP